LRRDLPFSVGIVESKGEKLTLLHTRGFFLSRASLPTYSLSLFTIPSSCEDGKDKERFPLLWEGRKEEGVWVSGL